MTHPKCTRECRFYRMGYVETHPVATRYPPACEHPSRAAAVDVERDQEREDCPLRKHLMVLSTDEAAALLPHAPKNEREGGE